jgi:hypothetical protein
VVEGTTDDLTVVRAAGLATARYQDWRPAYRVPVRTTVGTPHFWQHGELEFVPELAPYGIFGRRLPDDDACARYAARLDRETDRVVAALADLARRHRGRRLCLLCFENVAAGETCHRRWFAEWCSRALGIEVPELATPPVIVQPRLF